MSATRSNDATKGFFLVTHNTSIASYAELSKLAPTKGSDNMQVVVPKDASDYVRPVFQLNNVCLRYPYSDEFKTLSFALSAEQKKILKSFSDSMKASFNTVDMKHDTVTVKVPAPIGKLFQIGQRYNIMISLNDIYTHNNKLYVTFRYLDRQVLKSSIPDFMSGSDFSDDAFSE